MVYKGKSNSYGWFGGTPISGSSHIYICIYIYVYIDIDIDIDIDSWW